MATVTGVKVAHGTLVAATADTVTMSATSDAFEVINRGTTELYFNINRAAAATVGGADCYALPGGSSFTLQYPLRDTLKLSVISTGTPTYSVTVGAPTY